ncbi:MAG: TusE/DsrC/DsvC family sulfur relay protein [Acidobacteriota bacterium]
MTSFSFGGRTYAVDTEDFLASSTDWDENFARGMAPKAGIIGGLSEDHWRVIRFIRDSFVKTGRCPLVYETCRTNRLHLQELKTLFPTGYLRGACKLAGVTYAEGYLDQAWVEELAEHVTTESHEKVYEVNVRGFLLNPYAWDERFALYKAWEMKMPKLTQRHWEVIRFLRKSFEANSLVPTVYDTCEATGVDVEELERLFPDGYHRGAVKVAGLRVR